MPALTESDRAATEAFLSRHRDTSMFLRSNILANGFEDTGALRTGVVQIDP